MKPVSSPPAARRERATRELDTGWRDRSARLYAELERPAKAMLRRAFRGAFADEELDDIYSGAWVGTLRALERRHTGLDDEEIRKYLLTAVANQASKELRRRKRKPTAPLELIGGVADETRTPEEEAAVAERSRITRDLLTSLPPRRRAVMLLRYGWGLEPRQVCDMVPGLSRRAYRKEITRGVDELTERMDRFERGEWCSERAPLLKAYAAGLADNEQSRQAQAHLAHCRDCSDFVARLGGHLHDLGAGLAVPGALDAIDGRLSFADRLSELGDRARDAAGGMLSRGGDGVQEAATHAISAGGARGAGAAGAGVLAKLAGIGTAGKIAVACIGGGAAATACIGAGLVPGAALPGGGSDRERSAPGDPAAETRVADERPLFELPIVREQPSADVPAESPPPAEEPVPAPPPEPVEPVEPVAPTAPPVVQEFGVAPAAAPAPSSSGSSGDPSSSGGGGSAVQQEFGP